MTSIKDCSIHSCHLELSFTKHFKIMGQRLSKIVTKTGDQGSTGLSDGSRRLKNDSRIQCIGEVDELNTYMGLISSTIETPQVLELLQHIQHDLFDLGAELSQPEKQLLTEDYVEYLNSRTQDYNADLPALKEFILPGGSTLLGFIHLARVVARRVERSFVGLQQLEPVNPVSLQYLNRLSDLLFILARFMANETGQKEIFWQSQFSRINR